MSSHHAVLEEVVEKDPRYAYQAYEFVFAALAHTQKMLGRVPVEEGGEAGPQHHVSGRELLEGVRDLAVREFGLMARTVFHLWGIDRTDDFGQIVFNLVQSKLMSKTEEDDPQDFHEVYNLDEALSARFEIRLDEGEE